MDGDRMAGSTKKTTGKVERAAGRARGDDETQPEGAVGEAAGATQASLDGARNAARDYLDQAGGYVEGAREAAGRAVARGRRYVDDGLDMLPDAGEAFDRSRAVVGREIKANPLASLLIAGAVGYGLALLVHGLRRDPPPPPPRRRGRNARS